MRSSQITIRTHPPQTGQNHTTPEYPDETFEKRSISVKIKANESRFSGINHSNILNISSPASAERMQRPPEIRHAHKSGDFHIHDLNILAPYCDGWDLKDLLINGFKGVEGKVESAPPKHLRSALGQLVNFLCTLQGEAAGAQAISNFDTLLAPPPSTPL